MVELPEIKAGFPSPAQDYSENIIDLNRELVKNPASTFFGRAKGESMLDAGISDGDILIIDKSIEPYQDAVAVCFIDGEFTLKRVHFVKEDGQLKEIWLMPQNKEFKPIVVTPDNTFLIWGIVTYSIKSHKR
ncbi:MAG: translesion error-prone DNA polymerase V autoproteolytic subunit [Bacteroidales bacterium]|jgi:DNA polymerase V|nr:translesion error-prone DNA polymerase V autoproteolytic subunit [Bacteroidales bacterium]MBO7305117.1 translesion error-prone DNA polymerase V autoproteolytic subunit [Bacteroidales bacterium]MBQ1219635.1 translesion error-prone DNA polymerase V autoproteolytic subunit [Bacteroidales bacterium]MBQ1929032.1 translesion error-prone DNA polymerase V autoproteolytic subunit [Bacteroidales bacterium]MBQ5784064.1 translesion error-prone DNA polymerase V autoproteolytic subunit [Bacteroidales bact